MEANIGLKVSSVTLRTPEQRRDYRKSLHKAGGCSPAWKDTYRKRCMARLRDSRQKFLSRFRSPDLHMSSDSSSSSQQTVNSTSQLYATTSPESPLGINRIEAKTMSSDVIRSTVQEVMIEEWDSLRTEHSELPVVSMDPRRHTDDIDYVLSIMDELTQELIQEEQAILLQYEQEKKFDEESLCAAIESLSTNDIICPICQKNVLQQNHHIIFCACGIRIDTAQDGVTLDFIRKELEECSRQHSSLCSGKPIFSLETTLGIQNIIMNCSTCDFMFIVI